MERISFGGLLGRSWCCLRGKRWLAIGILLFWTFANGVVGQVPFAGIFLWPSCIGFALFFLQLAQGKPVSFQTPFMPFLRYWHSLWAVVRPLLIVGLWGLLPFTVFCIFICLNWFGRPVGEVPADWQPPLWLLVNAGIGLLLLPILAIPMTVAWLQYSLTPYIVCRNPEMPVRDAMVRSTELMVGHKWRLLGYRILLGILAGLAFILTTAISLYYIFLSKQSAPYEFAGTTVIWVIAGFLFAFYLLPLISAFMANFYVAVSGDTGIDPEPGPAELTEAVPEGDPAA